MNSWIVLAIFQHILLGNAEKISPNLTNVDSFGFVLELFEFNPKDLSTKVNWDVLKEVFENSAVAHREILVISCIGLDSDSKHVINQILLQMYENVSKLNK